MYVRDYHKRQFVAVSLEALRDDNIEMRKHESRYFQEKIEECEKTDPKTTWRLINCLTNKFYKSNCITEI